MLMYSRAGMSLLCKRHCLLTWSLIWAWSLLMARIKGIVSLTGVSNKVDLLYLLTRVTFEYESIRARRTSECFCSLLLVRQEVGGRYISATSSPRLISRAKQHERHSVLGDQGNQWFKSIKLMELLTS